MQDSRDEVRRARFEAVAAEVWDPLARYLARRTDPDTAQEVLADALLVLWRRLDDVPADAALPWAYGVARGCLANARRAQERRLRLAERVAAEPVAAPGDVDVDLDEALVLLSERDREVLRLWAWEDLSAGEIALALGTSTALASVRLSRAKSRLRRACKTVAGAGQEQGRRGEEAPR